MACMNPHRSSVCDHNGPKAMIVDSAKNQTGWDPEFDRYTVHSRADKSQPDCQFTSFTHVQCRLEQQAGNEQLAKRCQKLKKSFSTN